MNMKRDLKLRIATIKPIPTSNVAPHPEPIGSGAHLQNVQVTPEPPPQTPQPSSLANRWSEQFAEGKPVREKGLARSVRWLNSEEASHMSFAQLPAKFKKLLADPLKRRQIGSRDEAVAHLEVNVSMALRPTVALEDDAFFYFSGGTTAYAVKDFSKGMAVSKATGEIFEW